jgi:hypothetical protein
MMEDVGRAAEADRLSQVEPEDGLAAARVDPSRLKWHIGDNLRWLADQPSRPGHMPCGILTGSFLLSVADSYEKHASRIAVMEIVLSNAAIALQEAGNLLRGHGLNGCASIMDTQAKRCREVARDRDGSGEASETGTGSTEGNSPGLQGIAQGHSS